jgi:NAD(P)-dependent dehydrogenase (short-subunit alcohol dehydrogenase family)
MNNRICLITGATGGIGQVTARELARQGATVVIAGRNREKCVAVADTIKEQTGNPHVAFLVADLSVQREVHHLAEQFKQQYDRLDVLVNNAGALYMARQLSADGIELTFALNHLNYFLLTHLLLESLRASPAARIINVASDAHRGAQIDFANLQGEKRYQSFPIYSQSKLANILFTYELARRLGGAPTANALHPGFVATNFGKNNGWGSRIFMSLLHRFAINEEQGAQTTLYLATSPEVAGVTGKYFVKQQAVSSSPASYDAKVAQQLWRVSEQMTGINSQEFGLAPAAGAAVTVKATAE